MSKLKRNFITLVKEVKEGEIITETYYTPPFIPFSAVYEAVEIMSTMEEGSLSVKEMADILSNFIADNTYNKQFTTDDLLNGLHAPDAVRILQEQIRFVSDGYQSDETKAFLEKKR